VDSNHRRRKPADLQSAPVGRLGIPPAEQHPVKQYTVKTARNSDGRLGRCQRSAFANIGFTHSPDACGRWERICAAPTRLKSDVEPKMQYVAFLNPVFLAFQPKPAGIAGAGLAAVFDVIVVTDGFGANEALLEIGMDHGCGLRRG
jgi:hypothetical protein